MTIFLSSQRQSQLPTQVFCSSFKYSSVTKSRADDSLRVWQAALQSRLDRKSKNLLWELSCVRAYLYTPLISKWFALSSHLSSLYNPSIFLFSCPTIKLTPLFGRTDNEDCSYQTDDDFPNPKMSYTQMMDYFKRQLNMTKEEVGVVFSLQEFNLTWLRSLILTSISKSIEAQKGH